MGRWVNALHGKRTVGIGVGDIAFGVVLSAAGMISAGGTGSNATNDNAGVVAAIAVLLMTVPVVFARRAPLEAAAALAVGAALNWAVVGTLTRCGAALPAVFYVGFMLGYRHRRLPLTVLGLAFLTANLLCQSYSDPKLGGPNGGVWPDTAAVFSLMIPITLGLLACGGLVRARTASVAALRDRTAQLRQQRELNAELAVAAEQARIAGDLDGFLQAQIGHIATTAAAGTADLSSRPDDARAAFVAIQHTGRATLTHMRSVVTGLRDDAPIGPQPVLAQLDRLLTDGTEADARLQVVGDPRLLPSGVELSGYRIVEHLLVALSADPHARVDVVVRFEADALELTVSGPPPRRAVDGRAALAAAAERAALHGGALRTRADGAVREVVVHLPLATARA